MKQILDIEDYTLVRDIEEMTITAWPAFQQILMDGWLLRFADGYTFRSNSVQSIYQSSQDVLEKIRWCEELYASKGLPAAFKITPVAQPSELDSVLASRGYRQHTPTSVQVLDVLPEPVADGSDAGCVSLDEWLEAYSSISSLPVEKRSYHAGIVERIPLPLCTMVLKHDGQPVACGLGVLHDRYIGLYDICTVPSLRRMGLATRVINGLLCWASKEGATGAYLQVVAENAPAIALYEKLGFRHVYSYWYRVKDGEIAGWPGG